MGSFKLRKDALDILNDAIAEMLPDQAVEKVLASKTFKNYDKCVVIAIGKAAWTMANTAAEILGDLVSSGLVLTKYHHSQGDIKGFEIIEAGHPLPDENSELGASKALDLVEGLSENDIVIFLVSGGGSSLFEKPLDDLSIHDIQSVTDKLLASGADIVEINKVRKHLSAVKGGRFAKKIGKAKILTIVLSDVIGDRLDAIASGPTYPDASTSDEAIAVLRKYNITVDEPIYEAMKHETPKKITNCESIITGSVNELCNATALYAEAKGYNTYIISNSVDCEARELGEEIGHIAKDIHKYHHINNYRFTVPCALIIGGETVVHLKGCGKGGRNQEIALAAALEIRDLPNTVVAAIGSDGTDGPTDAAGGIVDNGTVSRMIEQNISPIDYLDDNNSYVALKISNDLIITGPTGTNVNDVALLLIG